MSTEQNSNLVMQNMQLSYNPHPQVTPPAHFSSTPVQVTTRAQPVAALQPHAIPVLPQPHPQVTPQTHFATPAQVTRPPPPIQQQKARPQTLPMTYQSKYGELLNVIEDLGREIKPTYAGSKMAQERLKKGIMHARALVRECLAEVEKSARQ